MFIRVIKVQLSLEESYSLKDKRQVLQSLISKVRQKFNVSIIESDFHDQWSRSELGIAILTTQMNQLEFIENAILEFAETSYPIVITGVEVNDY